MSSIHLSARPHIARFRDRAVAHSVSELDKRGLNPQPLPPKAIAQLSSKLDQVALNPQPLPPKERAFIASLFAQRSASHAETLLDRVGLNPQPLPPREFGV